MDCSSEKKLVHGEWKKHLFICFKRGASKFKDFSHIRYISVDNLIQPPPSDEPFLSQDDAEVEVLRARQSWRRRDANWQNSPEEYARVDDIGWRGLGCSVFLSHEETTPPPPIETFKLLKHPTVPPLNIPHVDMACINVEHKLYFLGGHVEQDEYSLVRTVHKFSKEVHCYDLLKKISESHFRCADMIQSGSGYREVSSWATPPLVVHIDNKIYVLCYFPNETSKRDYDNAGGKDVNRTFCFQEYDVAKNEWTLLPLFDGAENFDLPLELNDLSHVVIGKKWCVSFGNSSFAFDTVNCVWEDCILFKTNKKRMRDESVVRGGPSFKKEFTGRGIVWDGDILLGIGGTGGVVAFQLVEGRVVNTMELTVKISAVGLSMGYSCDPTIIDDLTNMFDLGGGYFCLMQNVRNVIVDGNHRFNKHGGFSAMALVTFRISRVEKQEHSSDDKEFITCQVVEPKALLLQRVDCFNSPLHAFCL